ncbi:MAG: hypothetical protein ACXV5S_11725 [Acidimicrobiales bacterium]
MAIDWFVVTCEDESIHLSVQPPGQDSWTVDIPWDAIVRVCFKAEDATTSDGLYVFTDLGDESVAIPTEAAGGGELLGELVRRGLFDSELAVTASTATIGLFCWPPD